MSSKFGASQIKTYSLTGFPDRFMSDPSASFGFLRTASDLGSLGDPSPIHSLITCGIFGKNSTPRPASFNRNSHDTGLTGS